MPRKEGSPDNLEQKSQFQNEAQLTPVERSRREVKQTGGFLIIDDPVHGSSTSVYVKVDNKRDEGGGKPTQRKPIETPPYK
jgi:hypothetical protein